MNRFSFESTYKELKLTGFDDWGRMEAGFESTYKELKLARY